MNTVLPVSALPGCHAFQSDSRSPTVPSDPTKESDFGPARRGGAPLPAAASNVPFSLWLRRFWCLLLFNFDFHRRNLLGLVMMVVIPVGLLVFYSFVYYMSNVPPSLTVGYSANVPAAVREAWEASEMKGVHFYPVESSPEETIRENIAMFHVGYDEASGEVVVHARSSAHPMAELLKEKLAAPPPPVATADGAPARPAVGIADLSDGNSALTFLPAMLIMALMNLALFSTGNKILEDRANGTLRILRTFPVPPWLVFSADLTTKFVLAIVLTVLFVLIGGVMLGHMPGLVGFGLTLLVSALSALALIAFSFALGSMLPRYSSGVHVFTALNIFFGFLGDIIFPTASFPVTRPLAALLPTTHCVNLLRVVMLDIAPTFPPAFSLIYLTVFIGLCCFLGARCFSFSAKA